MLASVLALTKAKLEPLLHPRDFFVFVFGPALDADKPVIAPTSRLNGDSDTLEHARYLRYRTKQRLEELGFSVDFGEAKDVLKFWLEFFHAPDAATAEIHHASKASGAVVIFPGSFGSMAELALFARQDDIAEKTVAIVHESYATASSFFRQGLIEIFETYNGKTKYVNYANHDVCVEYAVRFVRSKYSKALAELEDVTRIRRRNRGKVFDHALEDSAD
jgi:hypothetical protein